jgi:hypothetical protein
MGRNVVFTVAALELLTALWALGTASYDQALLRWDAYFSLVVVTFVVASVYLPVILPVAMALCLVELMVVALAVSTSAYQQGILLLDLLFSVALTAVTFVRFLKSFLLKRRASI